MVNAFTVVNTVRDNGMSIEYRIRATRNTVRYDAFLDESFGTQEKCLKCLKP